MFQKHDESGHNREHTPEDTFNPTLESIDITLKGGVETKLFLNRLHTREKYRWQTGSVCDLSKASGSGSNPKTRLCSPDGETPLMALKAWILAHGYKLEEASRRDVASRVWRKGLPKNPHRKGDKGELEKGKGTQEEQVTRQQDVAEATVGQGEPDTDRSQDYPGSGEKRKNKTGTKARTKGPNIPKLTSSVT